MRLRITLCVARSTALPINYNPYLTAAVYGFLERSSVDYARFLHDEGYKTEDGTKRFKFFTYSMLRVPASRRRIVGNLMHIAPGPLDWIVSSPVDDFLQNFAGGLLKSGNLQLGPASFAIDEIQALPQPSMVSPVRFSCLSPIIAPVRRDDGTTEYLLPTAGAAFSEAIRKNLINKHQVLVGAPPADDTFAMQFDQEYLAKSNGGTKLVTFNDIQMRGAFAPFTATGSAELIAIGYEAGFGGKGALGFGCAEVREAA